MPARVTNSRSMEGIMNPWICATLICAAGAAGGLVNAMISQNGFALPKQIEGVWCPGELSTIVAGTFAAFASWAFYGSGATIDIADSAARRICRCQLSPE